MNRAVPFPHVPTTRTGLQLMVRESGPTAGMAGQVFSECQLPLLRVTRHGGEGREGGVRAGKRQPISCPGPARMSPR